MKLAYNLTNEKDRQWEEIEVSSMEYDTETEVLSFVQNGEENKLIRVEFPTLECDVVLEGALFFKTQGVCYALVIEPTDVLYETKYVQSEPLKNETITSTATHTATDRGSELSDTLTDIASTIEEGAIIADSEAKKSGLAWYAWAAIGLGVGYLMFGEKNNAKN